MARCLLCALLCLSGARAAAALLVQNGQRSPPPRLPWEDSTHSILASFDDTEIENYRALKRKQLLDFIDTGRLPPPQRGELERKLLWERYYLQKSPPTALDKKVQAFLNQQVQASMGPDGNSTFGRIIPVKVEAPPPKKVKAEAPPVPHSNGTRYMEVLGRHYKVMNFYHMHIPRTGGTSFVADSVRMVVNNPTLTMFSKEGCYAWKDRFPYVDGVVTMVRNPRAHVLSQFLYCSKGPFAGWTQVHKFKPWVEDWNKIMKKGSLVGDFGSRSHTDKQIYFQRYVTHSMMPFHCYSPLNLQVQHFSCRGGPFNYSAETQTQQAIQNMKDSYFVGITEAYQESMCLFHAKVHDVLPLYCDCKNSDAWRKFNGTHMAYYLVKVKDKEHDVKSWQPETTALVDNLTRADLQLYQASVARFAKEIHEAEQRFNTTIMCDDKLEEQSRLEDPVKRDFAIYMREARATLKARP